MYEPLLERIRVLEGSVQRWRRVSLALAILLISCLAISGTFSVVLLFSQRGMRAAELQMQAERAAIEREQALQAQMEADVARQRAEELKKQLEAKVADGMDP
jgi:hypothetical protein